MRLKARARDQLCVSRALELDHLRIYLLICSAAPPLRIRLEACRVRDPSASSDARASIRLPVVVPSRRASLVSLDFPTRPMAPSAIDNQPQDLPVPEHGFFHACTGTLTAWTQHCLAIPTLPISPSASPYCVGAPDQGTLAAQYPARTYPCQRVGDALACGRFRMTQGQCRSLILHRMTLSFTTLCRFNRRTWRLSDGRSASCAVFRVEPSG
jgi:hypothetical protein